MRGGGCITLNVLWPLVLSFFKVAHSRPLFIYFRLFNTADNKQMFNKILPMTGVEPRTSGIESDCSANWATTTSPNQISLKPRVRWIVLQLEGNIVHRRLRTSVIFIRWCWRQSKRGLQRCSEGRYLECKEGRAWQNTEIHYFWVLNSVKISKDKYQIWIK